MQLTPTTPTIYSRRHHGSTLPRNKGNGLVTIAHTAWPSVMVIAGNHVEDGTGLVLCLKLCSYLTDYSINAPYSLGASTIIHQ